MGKRLVDWRSVFVLSLFVLLPLVAVPGVTQAGTYVPVIGAIPEEFLKATMPAPKFSGEVRLGALYPRSGQNSYLGEEAWRGVELARSSLEPERPPRRLRAACLPA